MKINIGITDENRQKIADILSKILADEFVLLSRLLNAHWNVEGHDFHSVHEYLDGLYHDQLEVVDTVAEKIRQVGHYVPASLEKYQELTSLTEITREDNNSQAYFKELTGIYDSIIINLREQIVPLSEKFKAEGISDYVTGLMEDHEKTAWMLRSHIVK